MVDVVLIAKFLDRLRKTRRDFVIGSSDLTCKRMFLDEHRQTINRRNDFARKRVARFILILAFRACACKLGGLHHEMIAIAEPYPFVRADCRSCDRACRSCLLDPSM